MAYSEIKANIGIVPTRKNGLTVDLGFGKLLKELTGYSRSLGDPVEMVIIEPYHDYLEVDRNEIEGTFLCLPSYSDGGWRVFYDRGGKFPTNGLYAPVSNKRMLQRFKEEGVEIVPIAPLKELSIVGGPGQARGMRNFLILKNYQDASSSDFGHQTHIPEQYAFKPGRVATVEDILERKEPVVDPLSMEDIRQLSMKSLRDLWESVGIIEGTNPGHLRSLAA